MTILQQFASSAPSRPANAPVVRDFPPQFETFGDWSNESKPVAFMFGFNKWKRECVSYYLPEYRPVYCPMKWKLKTVAPHIDNEPNKVIIFWGYKGPEGMEEYAAANNITIVRMEDGFIRSVGLGAEHAMPYSLILDKKGLYFDSRQPSDLEDLLNTYDFAANPTLLDEARESMRLLNDLHISKYNLYNNEKPDIEQIYGPKTAKRILVVGQVEQDASIKYGCPKPVTNKILLELAMSENPGADIIFKPHPDVLVGKQPALSDPSVYADRVKIVTDPLSIPDALKTIDHVYTITSLSGFEALIRGISVTTYGAPFYSGWGLTDDRSPVDRRKRKLSVEEVFAGSYLLYPSYVEPDTGKHLKAIDVIHMINDQVKNITAQPPAGTEPAPAAQSQQPDAQALISLPVPVPQSPTASLASPNGLPGWYQPVCGPLLKHALRQGQPLVVALTAAVDENFEQILDALAPSLEGETLQRLDWLKPEFLPSAYSTVQQLAWQQPGTVRKLLLSRLTRLAGQIKVMLLPEDISPLGRLIVQVCRELNLATVLLPTQWPTPSTENYYRDQRTGADLPACDWILTWNGWQEQIFQERGYPANRMHRVGTPLLEVLTQGRQELSKELFSQIYGLNPWQPVWLTVLPDAAPEATSAEQIVTMTEAVITEAQAQGAQVLIWQTGSAAIPIVSPAVATRWSDLPHVAVETDAYPLCALNTARHHVDGVLAFETEHLIPAAVLKRPVILLAPTPEGETPQSLKPLADWQLPLASQQDQLAQHLAQWQHPNDASQAAQSRLLQQIEQRLACDHEEPGWSLEAVRHWLQEVVNGHQVLAQRPTLWDHYQQPNSDWPISRIALPTKRQPTESGLPPVFRQLLAALPAQSWIPGIVKEQQWGELYGTEAIVQFDNHVTSAEANRTRLNKPRVVVTDGLIQSGSHSPANNSPKLSLMLDDSAPYYEATRQSRFQSLLESDWMPDDNQRVYATQLIERMNRLRISQFNHLPDPRIVIGQPGRSKVLVVNQRRDDPTVAAGIGMQSSFVQMLNHVLSQRRDAELIILQPPGSQQDPSANWLGHDDLAITRDMDNVHLVQYDLHPHALLDQVDEVFVVTAQLGFEALMRGKRVHCFGAPFYANRGITQDRVTAPNRLRERSLEEVFCAAYLVASRYFIPGQDNTPVTLDVLLDHLEASRN